MTTQPTQNPVPSESPRDLKFNAGKIDEFVTSMGWTYTDRSGNKHYTIEGLRHIAQEAISAFGYVTVDSFEDGVTLNLPNEVLRWKERGEYYRWDGEFPKEVPAGSTPESAGGIGIGAWVSVGDASLRRMMAGYDIENGDALVAFKQPITGAIDSTVHEKLSRYVDALDFAVGDGVTDDTEAFNNMISAGITSIDGRGKSYKVNGIPVFKKMINIVFDDVSTGQKTYALTPFSLTNTDFRSTRWRDGSTPIDVVVFGYKAAESLNKNTSRGVMAIGAGALNSAITADGNMAIGSCAMVNATPGSHNIAIGNDTLTALDGSEGGGAATRNIAIGSLAGHFLTTGYQNTFIGRDTGHGVITGFQNTGIGYRCCGAGWNPIGIDGKIVNQTPINQNSMTAVGVGCLELSNGYANTAIGTSAGSKLKSANRNVLIGSSAGKLLDNHTSYNGFILSDISLSGNYTASGNLLTLTTSEAHGLEPGKEFSVLFTSGGAASITTEVQRYIVASIISPIAFNVNIPDIGDSTGNFIISQIETSTASDGSFYNTIVGVDAVNTSEGVDHSVIVGRGVSPSLTGTMHTIMGTEAATNLTGGAKNTIIGSQAGVSMLNGAAMASATNVSILGSGAGVSGSNQVQLGNSTTTTYVYGTVQNRSDERDKTDISAIDKDLAVKFVRGLTAKFYRWDMRDDYFETYQEKSQDEESNPIVITRTRPIPKNGSKKRNRLHAGFIAQEVKELLDKLGIDFGFFQDHSVDGGCDVMSLGYDEAIPLNSAAIAAAWDEIDSIKERITDLERKAK